MSGRKAAAAGAKPAAVAAVDEQAPAAPVDEQAPAAPVDEQAPAAPADEQAPTEPADAVTPADEVQDDVEAAEFVSLVDIGGTRNGEPWPAIGERFTLPVEEGEQYARFGYVERV